jgi:hypothetical protein
MCTLHQTIDVHARFTLAGLLACGSGAGELDLTPKTIALFELTLLSARDSRFVDWGVGKYTPGSGVFVKPGWRDCERAAGILQSVSAE